MSMRQMQDLTGRVALLTGADGGIGRATAFALGRAGAALILSSENSAGCEELRRALAAEQIDATVVVASDLSDPTAVEQLAEYSLRWRGRVDILICNGGIEGPRGPLGDAAPAALDRMFQVNLRSALTLCGRLAPQMAPGRGSIVLVSSIAGVRGNKSIGAYGLSKAALAQLARNLAVEWGPGGVRANAISPGVIATRLAQPLLDDKPYLARRLLLTPLRRVGRPEEAAAAILFLASDAAGFITGHNLIVDGGTTISDGN